MRKSNMTNNKIKISVLFPARGRTESLKTAVMSLIESVSDPETLEILLAIDDDDIEVLDYLNDDLLPKTNNIVKVYEFKRLGYKRLNAYVNTLASLAKGEFLVFFSDDAIMETNNWDLEILSYANSGNIELLKFSTNHNHPFAVFPVVKKIWFDLLGFFSPITHIDKFTYNISQNLPNGLVNIKAYVKHDRADLTGNNKDATYEYSSTSYNEGHPEDPSDSDSNGALWMTINSINVFRKYLNDTKNAGLPLIDIPNVQ